MRAMDRIQYFKKTVGVSFDAAFVASPILKFDDVGEGMNLEVIFDVNG
jgi:hypothetical protein